MKLATVAYTCTGRRFAGHINRGDDEMILRQWATRMRRARHRVEHWPALFARVLAGEKTRAACVRRLHERFGANAPEPPASSPSPWSRPGPLLAAATRGYAYPHWSAAFCPRRLPNIFNAFAIRPPSHPPQPAPTVLSLFL